MARRREQRLAGWGGIAVPGRERRSENLAEVAREAPLTRGLGRAYGDSALPPPGCDSVAGSTRADRILGFDAATGRLRAESGVSLHELVWTFLPRGWFPPVVPGTQFVTLGGMVAADVHGKNHHVDGTFGRHVRALRLMTASGAVLECSREREAELFRATLGGMGLTGHVLEVELDLAPVASPWILQESVRVGGIDELLERLAAAALGWRFTVAWVDVLARGRGLGRGALICGRWAQPDETPGVPPRPLRRLTVPFRLPGWVLNDFSVGRFNAIYRRTFPRTPRRGVVHPEKFFFPLDAIRHWNRIYGAGGFTQFQCVLPERERPGSVRRFLEEAAERGGSSFLCVLKDCGDPGEGLLSFPRPGISVALDLPVRRGTPALVEALADRVVAEGGRIYLAKDAFVRADQLAAMEPRLEEFGRVRDRWDPQRRLRSAQSVRLLGDPA
jgi:decaprenylphospho-beta-D-ribofuranose 2-oxidase